MENPSMMTIQRTSDEAMNGYHSRSSKYTTDTATYVETIFQGTSPVEIPVGKNCGASFHIQSRSQYSVHQWRS